MLDALTGFTRSCQFINFLLGLVGDLSTVAADEASQKVGISVPRYRAMN